MIRCALTWTLLECVALLPQAYFQGTQSPKKPDRPANRPAKKYQVDFRIQVAPELDKQRVLSWTNLIKELGAAGVSQVPGTPAVPGEDERVEPPIQAAGPNQLTVRAILGPSGNLFIGTEGYRIADRGKLAALIKSLQSDGVPPADPASPMWGLAPSQMDLLQSELKQPSRFDLKAATFDAFISHVRGRIVLELKLSPEAQTHGKSLKLTQVTDELSLGAAVAYVLGQNGLAWEPRQAVGGSVAILIMTSEQSRRPWPVGLTPEQMPGHIAPNLMATARYQTNNTPLGDVLAVFRRELKMDVLLDGAGIIERGINPDTLRSTIQIPGGTFLSAVRKTLAPLGLKHELRLDEANRAFLWVTVSEPTGPAKKK
jgi:hypothetical protein